MGGAEVPVQATHSQTGQVEGHTAGPGPAAEHAPAAHQPIYEQLCDAPSSCKAAGLDASQGLPQQLPSQTVNEPPSWAAQHEGRHDARCQPYLLAEQQ